MSHLPRRSPIENTSLPVVALVVAAAENGVIGRGGALPWRMPSDLKTFRRLTLGKPVVMGRKTFQSIGKPLDRRDNIVVSRNADFHPPPHPLLHLADGLPSAIALAQKLAAAAGVREIMIIGGADIYRQALPLADVVYLTRVHAEPDGDATFAPLDPQMWEEVVREPIVTGVGDDHAATLLIYRRRTRNEPHAAA